MKLSYRKNSHMCSGCRGAALPSAVILLVSLTLIAVTVAYRATLDEQMGANQRDALNAMSLADSGIEAGFAEVKANYNALGADLGLLADAGIYLVSDNAISGGSYAVTILPAPDYVEGERATLRSVGLVNGAERVTELLLAYEPGGSGSEHTILTNGEIQFSSNQRFVGPIISIHSNTWIKHGAAPLTCTSAAVCGTEQVPPTGYMSSSGGFDPKTYDLLNQAYPWELDGSAAVAEIPHVYPPDWQPYATVELTADCRIIAGQSHPTASPGTLLWNENTQGVWHGWSCSPGQIWEMKSSSASLYAGFYYIHGNIKISASPPDIWAASFVAAGTIEITCCTQFKPWGQTGNEIADNIFLLSGNDIGVTGKPGNVVEGIIAAHMEVKIAGGGHFKGSILAENGKHFMGQEVTTNVQTIKNITAYNSFTNETTIEGTGIGLSGGSPQLVVAGWRELVH